MKAERPGLQRWLVLALGTVAGGWVSYALGGVLVGVALGGSAGFLRLLLAAYAALAAGFLITALVTRLAPGRRYVVAVALVFVMVVVAAALMLRYSSEAGPLPAVLLGTALVVGAFGSAIRVRGFSESISGREL